MTYKTNIRRKKPLGLQCGLIFRHTAHNKRNINTLMRPYPNLAPAAIMFNDKTQADVHHCRTRLWRRTQ
ncbi:hypothetical protein GE21DRAFT_1293413 [Neurospora crassa]|nr:hypothetical protein GE21DRAFT_1293413 [Neurospora crassa]